MTSKLAYQNGNRKAYVHEPAHTRSRMNIYVYGMVWYGIPQGRMADECHNPILLGLFVLRNKDRSI